MTEAKAKFEPSASDYALTTHAAAEAPAPELPYLPPMPKDRSTGIALVGAGGISAAHLDAYRAYGLNVLLICSRDLGRARGAPRRLLSESRRDGRLRKGD